MSISNSSSGIYLSIYLCFPVQAIAWIFELGDVMAIVVVVFIYLSIYVFPSGHCVDLRAGGCDGQHTHGHGAHQGGGRDSAGRASQVRIHRSCKKHDNIHNTTCIITIIIVIIIIIIIIL